MARYRPSSSYPKPKRSKITTKPAVSYYPPRPEGLVIVVDSNEQKPYTFPREYPTIHKPLWYTKKGHNKHCGGDYSIEGLEDKIAIERKTITDFYVTITDRKRMDRQRAKMKDVLFKAWVIEGSEEELYTPQLSWSNVHPNSVYGSVVSLNVKDGMHVYVGSRESCRIKVLNWLVKFYKEYNKQAKEGD